MYTSRVMLAARLYGSRAFSTSVRSRVKIIGSDEAYSQIITEGTGRKAIVYFTANWCPPCKMIGPIYDELSAMYNDIDFAKIDVDALNDTTSKAGVRSMPTFFCFNDGRFQQSLSFSGADESLLRNNVKQLNDL
ncbi:zz-type zinc finger-containing protein [Plasmopara halstedii]|uniref:Zz-type zinc finger-containing protein n=1 Tax=Plasmopara halstedii TaxID=4781 RepID=A0A0P1A4U7_PLAHL|nr:zz-type zinc finger-containing protein [Plasmopara halstedii]CEG35314.1 zz-type zinc finger-containing protein [Plasmopara halstedii]|eukprot:XP_024571683.1 zz-type zinc finger-containing protein [Plasmopara halstedii]